MKHTDCTVIPWALRLLVAGHQRPSLVQRVNRRLRTRILDLLDGWPTQ